MDRSLKSVAPNAPGNFKPVLKFVLCFTGVVDQYLFAKKSTGKAD